MADHVPAPVFRSKLKAARGLGSAKHGLSHWWIERLTALALVPLSLWFVYSLLTGLLSPDPAEVSGWLSSPLNAVALALFLIMTFIHTRLGNQVIIEDYVKCKAKKFTLVILNNFVCYGALALALLAVLKIHLGGFAD